MAGTAIAQAPVDAPAQAETKPGPAAKPEPKKSPAELRAEAQAAHKPSAAKRAAFDPRATAKKAMAERKQAMRLATVDGKTTIDEEDFRADPNNLPEGHPGLRQDKTDKADTASRTAPTAEDAKEPEKVPTWAQKLKADLVGEQAKTKVAAEREQRWQGGLERVKAVIAEKDFAIEDLQADVELQRHLIKQLMDFLDKAAPGQFVPESLDALLARHEVDKMKRAKERGTKATQAQALEQAQALAFTEVKGECDAIRQRYPELDWEKNPAAKGFFTRWLKLGAPKAGLQDSIDEFIAAQRWKASQAVQPKPARGVAAGEQPGTTSIQGGSVGSGTAHAQPEVITNGYARRLVRDFRAAKAARK